LQIAEDERDIRVVPEVNSWELQPEQFLGQSYDFGIYNYNASVVVGSKSVFENRIYFCFHSALGYL
jgi:hypothetical protein